MQIEIVRAIILKHRGEYAKRAQEARDALRADRNNPGSWNDAQRAEAMQVASDESARAGALDTLIGALHTRQMEEQQAAIREVSDA